MADINNSSIWSPQDTGNIQPSPNGWQSGTFPNQVEPIGRTTMAAIRRLWERSGPAITTTGSANNYVYTPTNGSYPIALVAGDVYIWIANFANSGAASLNVNGLGGINILKQGTSGMIPLTGSEIQGGQVVITGYDGTNFQMLSPSSISLSSFAPINNPTFTGTVTAPTLIASAGFIDGTPVGSSVPSMGNFTTLSIGGNTLATTAAATTWTPNLTFGGAAVGVTYTTQTGSYLVLGSLVICNFFIQLSNKGSSTGSVLLNNLPFTVASISGNFGAVSPCLVTSMTSVGAGVLIEAVATSTTANIVTPTSTSFTTLSDTNFSNTSVIEGTLIYFK